MLGAEGVQMGTRMVSAAESPVHDNWKSLIVRSAEADTVMLNRWGKPAFRVLVYFEGDLDAGFAFGGQVAGRISSVEPVATIIRRTVAEFHEVMADTAARWAPGVTSDG